MYLLGEEEKLEGDHRVYVTETGWKPMFHSDGTRLFCFVQRDGEEGHHLIAHGELFLRKVDESYCLNCAIKRGIVVTKRPVLGDRNTPPSDIRPFDYNSDQLG